jgi:hypothetical protein
VALAETAKLLASLDLKDGLTPAVKTMSGSLDRFDARLGKSSTRAYKAGQQIGTGIKNSVALIGGATVLAGAAVGGLFLRSISAANDLNETISKSAVVFGAANDKVLALGETASTALGLSKEAAIGAAATYGNLFVSMGLAQAKSADMSVALVNLAADLASFNNIDPAEALEKLRAGLTGESEPLKTLGVNINEALIKQKALDLGLVKLEKGQKKYTGTLPAAAKAQAAYALIFEQTKTAQGDATRTGEQFAGQTRKLAAVWTDAKAAFAGAALPGLAKILGRVVKLIKDNTPLIATFGDKIALLFSDENIATGTRLLGDAFDAARQAAPIVADAANKMLDVMKTSAAIFRSLPPELQALAVAGLAVNKLTGGLVTNIAGGLISAVISSFKGLMNVNAAVVNVNGGVGGVGGLAGAAGTAAGIGTGAALGLIAASVGATVVGSAQARALVDSLVDDQALLTAAEAARKHGVPDEHNAALQKLRRLHTVGPEDRSLDAGEKAQQARNTAFLSNPTRAELRVKIRDLKELKPTKDTQRAIKSLQGRLDHRIAEGNKKVAAATAAAQRAIVAAVNNAAKITVTVPVTNKTYFNGREVNANLGRFESSVNASSALWNPLG